MKINLSKRKAMLILTCMILLPEPLVGGTLEMDCGYFQFRLVDSWLAEPQLFEFPEYALDYYKRSCDVLKMDDNVITCANRHESFYRMNMNRIFKSNDFLLEYQSGEDIIISGINFHVIEQLKEGKWQEYHLHDEGFLSVSEPYQVAAKFSLIGNWQTVHESTWSFNFILGRFGTERINRIIQDGQVIDQKHESDVSSCEVME